MGLIVHILEAGQCPPLARMAPPLSPCQSMSGCVVGCPRSQDLVFCTQVPWWGQSCVACTPAGLPLCALCGLPRVLSPTQCHYGCGFTGAQCCSDPVVFTCTLARQGPAPGDQKRCQWSALCSRCALWWPGGAEWLCGLRSAVPGQPGLLLPSGSPGTHSPWVSAGG